MKRMKQQGGLRSCRPFIITKTDDGKKVYTVTGHYLAANGSAKWITDGQDEVLVMINGISLTSHARVGAINHANCMSGWRGHKNGTHRQGMANGGR